MNTLCEVTNPSTKETYRTVLCLEHLRSGDKEIHGPVYKPCDVCRVERAHKIVCTAIKNADPGVKPYLQDTQAIANLVGMTTTLLKHSSAMTDEDIADEILREHDLLFVKQGDRINPDLLKT